MTWREPNIIENLILTVEYLRKPLRSINFIFIIIKNSDLVIQLEKIIVTP